MEILCPNCQRKLSIEEKYAGQNMRCPLCQGTFTAPTLPASNPYAPALATQPASSPPQISTTPPSEPPGYGVSPPPPAYQSPASTPSTTSSSAPPRTTTPVPGEHTGRFSLAINPVYTQYVPAVALFLVFILTFFTWTGFRPGGVWVDSQSAWQVMFNSVSTDPDLTHMSLVNRDKKSDKDSMDPGVGVLMIFYILSLLFNLFVALVVVGLVYAKPFVPPAWLPHLRWGWPGLAVVTCCSFALLLLQDARGFPYQRAAHEFMNKQAKRVQELRDEVDKEGKAKRSDSDPARRKEESVQRGIQDQALVNTNYYRLAFWLHFWAAVFVFITMLAELRSPRPPPRVDLLW